MALQIDLNCFLQIQSPHRQLLVFSPRSQENEFTCRKPVVAGKIGVASLQAQDRELWDSREVAEIDGHRTWRLVL